MSNSVNSTALGLKDSGTRQAFSSGAVRDAQENKGRFDLMPPLAEFLISRIYEDGAKKYAARNWEKGIPIDRMVESGLRHLAKYRSGLRDEPHLTMAGWNILGAIHMAAMVQLGKFSREEFYNLPNYTGDLAGNEPLSPHEIKSLKSFLGISNETKSDTNAH